MEIFDRHKEFDVTESKKEFGINTQLVHAGERGTPPQGKPVSNPIYASATFTYDSMAEVDQVFSGEKQGYIYSRYGNPTVAALAEAVRVLEGGAAACAYSTGMAALHATIFACELSPGANDTGIAGSLWRDDRSALQDLRLVWH